MPSCAKPGKAIPRPEVLPSSFPVPAGTAFTRIDAPFPDQSIVSGVSRGDLDRIRSFYDEGLADAGYQQGRGESEPGQTEALFSGDGVRGGRRANVLPDCEGAVRLTLVVVKNPVPSG